MTTVVVAGVVAGRPHNGGGAWVRRSWVQGLARLGIDAWLVEQVRGDQSVDVLADVVASSGIDRWLLVDDDGRTVSGPVDAAELAGAAALLVNLSGHLAVASLLRAFRRRAYVDLDPGFTQFWHAQGLTGARLDGHDLYFTVGESIGTAACRVPTGGIRWLPVRPPVVLDDWPVTPAADAERFTTVGAWRGTYGRIEHDGVTYGLKAHEFRKHRDLPRLAPGRYEIALDIHPADDGDRRRLLDAGWQLTDPVQAAGDPDRFRRYVQRSGAEFSVAQGIYAETATGWFSDRTTRYLASGKPALVQDTGFSAHLPVGEGLVAFGPVDEAVTGAKAILADHDAHAAAARHLAEQHFDADRVLGRFLDQAGVSP